MLPESKLDTLIARHAEVEAHASQVERRIDRLQDPPGRPGQLHLGREEPLLEAFGPARHFSLR